MTLQKYKVIHATLIVAIFLIFSKTTYSQKIDSLLNIIEKTTDVTTKSEALVDLGAALYRSNPCI